MNAKAREKLILAQLARIRQSPQFAAAERQRRFLSHNVERTLAGESDGLKGYTIGIEAFDRAAEFDPAIDSIVRVEAGRLRHRLREYYADVGPEDRMIFELPKGGYVIRLTAEAGPKRPIERAGTHRSVVVLPMVSSSR